VQKFIAISIIIGAGIALHLHAGPDPLTAEEQLYCEMTQLYRDTHGQYGWPNYKHLTCENSYVQN
jgi:hypothetical protein